MAHTLCSQERMGSIGSQKGMRGYDYCADQTQVLARQMRVGNFFVLEGQTCHLHRLEHLGVFQTAHQRVL